MHVYKTKEIATDIYLNNEKTKGLSINPITKCQKVSKKS